VRTLKENVMGMSHDADEMVPIPEDIIEKLHEQAEGGHAAERLEALLEEEQHKDVNPPVFVVGEDVDIKGVRFTVRDISRERLVLQPCGWALDTRDRK
jgi:hypothetical protein